jgi:hypothetical protein
VFTQKAKKFLAHPVFNFIFSFFLPDKALYGISVQVGVAAGPNNMFMQAYDKEIIPEPIFTITNQGREGSDQDMLIGGIENNACGNWVFHKQSENWIFRMQKIGLNGMNRTNVDVVS